MKNKALRIQLCIIAVLLAISCNSVSTQIKGSSKDSVTTSEQTDGIDYSGVYKVSDENSCKLSITIIKEGQDYNYGILGEKLDYSGKLIVENIEDDIYFTFDGQIAENKPKSVSAKFVDGSIMIQNYGNSMNKYNYFKQCEEKYLEFKKSN
jgi:hypothetical protein